MPKNIDKLKQFMTEEWGKNDIGRIYRLSHACDRLQSKHDCIHGKENKRKRYR